MCCWTVVLNKRGVFLGLFLLKLMVTLQSPRCTVMDECLVYYIQVKLWKCFGGINRDYCI